MDTSFYSQAFTFLKFLVILKEILHPFKDAFDLIYRKSKIIGLCKTKNVLVIVNNVEMVNATNVLVKTVVVQAVTVN